ncbi:hypothetical protein TH4_18540 [Thalassospira tepidiphila MCCC 1A03514]|uniref:Uncharacterized protein n=2 Tax=Thalassospira tepidiphila TaxID=393657 RepID=A0A853KVQ1_9PROT|nr:hypothetical protein TH4_18540 [Thalassospira tepidiphila MCCC 1A03514]
MRASLAELNRRDRAAVAALGPDGRNVNVASDVFNDDEEGINSISEAIGRFGSWVQDRFGAGAPGGFAKSDAANGLATAAGFAFGGPVGGGLAGGAHGMYSAAPGRPNTIGNVARMASGVPGPVGGIATIAGLIDSAVDLDEGIALDDLPAGSPATAAAQSLNSVGLDDFPGGRQNDDPRIITGTSQPAKARTSAKSAVASNVARNKRRTFSPLNLRFAALRGVPTVEELL